MSLNAAALATGDRQQQKTRYKRGRGALEGGAKLAPEAEV